MRKIERKTIDWTATGRNIENMRRNDENLRRYACRINTENGTKNTTERNAHTDDCDLDCERCGKNEMDRTISRREFANIFGCSETVINNWENGMTAVPIEDLMLLGEIVGKDIFDIIVFG